MRAATRSGNTGRFRSSATDASSPGTALEGFRDTTGRPGPAGWELGHYPEGEDDLPVTGVSWYEAAAYAEFVGKTLPTLHHWRHAAGLGIGFEIVPLSNFGGRKPHPVGTDRSLSPYGTFDMAGNVKEWCWNETLRGERYIAGGAYGDPEYLFSEAERRPPFQRERTFGFRCVKYIEQPDASLLEPFDRKWRDFQRETPIPDNVFALVKSLYVYEKTDPRSQIVSRDTTDRDWKKESVTIDAAYGEEKSPSRLHPHRLRATLSDRRVLPRRVGAHEPFEREHRGEHRLRQLP